VKRYRSREVVFAVQYVGEPIPEVTCYGGEHCWLHPESQQYARTHPHVHKNKFEMTGQLPAFPTTGPVLLTEGMWVVEGADGVRLCYQPARFDSLYAEEPE
jgi:hypothetical protein